MKIINQTGGIKVFSHNDGKGEYNVLQNQFTAYLVKAVRNKKLGYLQSRSKQMQFELSIEIENLAQEAYVEHDITLDLPILEQIENAKFRQALNRQKENDLYIFFGKVLEDRSFIELSTELGMSYKAVTMRYYRMLSKIKSELMGGEKE